MQQQTTNFTNLIRHFISFSAIAAITENEDDLNLSYPNLSVFSDGSAQIAFSPDKFQDLKDIGSAIAYLKTKGGAYPLCFPLIGLDNAFNRFTAFDNDDYLRFYPLGFYWEYGKLETGGLEAGQTVDQLQEILKIYEKASGKPPTLGVGDEHGGGFSHIEEVCHKNSFICNTL
jgi:hypothetical protein